MGERVDKVRLMIDEHESAENAKHENVDRIRKIMNGELPVENEESYTYSTIQKDGNGNEITEEKVVEDINAELIRVRMHIERLEEEKGLYAKDNITLQQEYDKNIANSKNEEEMLIQEATRRQNLSAELEEAEKNLDKYLKDPLKNDEILRALTQEQIDIDGRILEVEAQMKLTLSKMRNFKLEYDQEGNAINGEDYKKLDTEYKDLTDELMDLKAAKDLCEEYLKKYHKEIDEIAGVYNRAKVIEEEPKADDKVKEDAERKQQEDEMKAAYEEENRKKEQEQRDKTEEPVNSSQEQNEDAGKNRIIVPPVRTNPSQAPKQAPVQSQAPAQAPKQAPVQSQAPAQAPKQAPVQSQGPAQAPKQVPVQSQAPAQAPKQVPVQSQGPAQAPKQAPVQSQAPAQAPKQAPVQSQAPAQTPKQAPAQATNPNKDKDVAENNTDFTEVLNDVTRVDFYIKNDTPVYCVYFYTKDNKPMMVKKEGFEQLDVLSKNNKDLIKKAGINRKIRKYCDIGLVKILAEIDAEYGIQGLKQYAEVLKSATTSKAQKQNILISYDFSNLHKLPNIREQKMEILEEGDLLSYINFRNDNDRLRLKLVQKTAKNDAKKGIASYEKRLSFLGKLWRNIRGLKLPAGDYQGKFEKTNKAEEEEQAEQSTQESWQEKMYRSYIQEREIKGFSLLEFTQQMSCAYGVPQKDKIELITRILKEDKSEEGRILKQRAVENAEKRRQEQSAINPKTTVPQEKANTTPEGKTVQHGER